MLPYVIPTAKFIAVYFSGVFLNAQFLRSFLNGSSVVVLFIVFSKIVLAAGVFHFIAETQYPADVIPRHFDRFVIARAVTSLPR